MTRSSEHSGIGQPVRRKEDARLIIGEGCYSDDFSEAGQAHAVMLRSPHAHARILSIDTRAAQAMPGVLAVLTGRDYIADGCKPVPNHVFSFHPKEIQLVNDNGQPPFLAPQYPLAHDKARYVGECVAIVIAESVLAAKDAAESIEVDYEPLACVTETARTVDADAPILWEEHGSNVCVDAHVGNAQDTAAAFARAAHVVRFVTQIQRVTGVPMEPRAALAVYDKLTDTLDFFAGSGGVVRLKNDLAHMLSMEPENVRAVMREVGGNFGTRGMIYPEFALVGWAARRLCRPVKWTCERSEAFLSDYQARDLHVEAELALAADGTFLAMRGSNIGNAGAHTGNFSPLQKGVEIMTSIYRIPAAHFRARAVVSNTMPTRPYRSAGRPEVMYVMERLIDLAARQCGFDRLELRRKNLVSEAEMPFTNAFGMVFDSGAYHAVMERVTREADWAGFEARRAEARTRGKCRGIGVANYVDTATGVPRERAEITVFPDGHVDVIIGTVSNGQGHETSFAQLVTEWLGVPIDEVDIRTGDTEFVKVGGGTHSGRGMRLASIVILKASTEIRTRAARVVGHILGVDPAGLQFERGIFVHPDDGRRMSLYEVAQAVEARNDLPDDLRGRLSAICDETVEDASFPYGSHVCEIEIDPETGSTEIIRYTTVDDAGWAVNPMIIHGQTHGGIAQGVGQALFEDCLYDAASGQLMAGSFMDYTMPRADVLPSFNTHIHETRSPTHPLGMRPAGEGGTTPALGVTINAVVDAIAHLGVRHVEMPATPTRIWHAINAARTNQTSPSQSQK